MYKAFIMLICIAVPSAVNAMQVLSRVTIGQEYKGNVRTVSPEEVIAGRMVLYSMNNTYYWGQVRTVFQGTTAASAQCILWTQKNAGIVQTLNNLSMPSAGSAKNSSEE